jgi:hypothetical protein
LVGLFVGALVGLFIGGFVGNTGTPIGEPGAAAFISSAEIFALSLIVVKTMVKNPSAPTLTVTDRVYAVSLPTC